MKLKKRMKLKELIKESWLDDKRKLTKEEKRQYLRNISEYNSLGKAIYREHNLVEIAKKLSEMCEQAERLAISESGDEFDAITVGRNMKELKTLSTQFGKVATEAKSLNQRMESLYEDMGKIIDRYYDVKSSDELVVGESN